MEVFSEVSDPMMGNTEEGDIHKRFVSPKHKSKSWRLIFPTMMSVEDSSYLVMMKHSGLSWALVNDYCSEEKTEET